MLASGTSGVLHFGSVDERLGSGLDVLVTSFAPQPQMFVFGATGFAAPLVGVGKLLGFTVTVVDWPHRWLAQQPVDERTVFAVLTHDPKLDIPTLEVALRSNAGYVGAMGSRRTHLTRLAQLRAAGIPHAELSRLHSAIGLHFGARTPEETAISIAAEIVQVRRGGSGRRLTATQGPVHPVSARS
jgi:xanthine dehydrogenase accessory factor